MALNWLWENKCGEATFRTELNDKVEEYTVSLYEGNAFLIFVYEYEENGQNLYTVQEFFVDKAHMNRCLGIDKKDEESYGYNMFSSGYRKLTKIRLNKEKSRNYKEIVKAFIQAFDEITVEIYKEA